MDFTDRVYPFLSDLTKNNNREWFLSNKDRYVEAVEVIYNFADEVMNEMDANSIVFDRYPAKKSVFRIYRDVRFSKNKVPYKTHFGIAIPYEGTGKGKGGYYLHVEPKNLFVAGGCWVAESLELRKIRQEIDYQSESFKAVILDKDFVTLFGKLDEESKLKLPPKGYTKDNPMIEWLKLKRLVVAHKISENTTQTTDILKEILPCFKQIEKLNHFLFNALK